jgi:hypothetical protein
MTAGAKWLTFQEHQKAVVHPVAACFAGMFARCLHGVLLRTRDSRFNPGSTSAALTVARLAGVRVRAKVDAHQRDVPAACDQLTGHQAPFLPSFAHRALAALRAFL